MGIPGFLGEFGRRWAGGEAWRRYGMSGAVMGCVLRDNEEEVCREMKEWCRSEECRRQAAVVMEGMAGVSRLGGMVVVNSLSGY